MRRSALFILCGGLTALGLFVAGFFVGVNSGIREFNLIEGSVRAALLVNELSALRAGSAQKLIDAKEVELDAEVVKAMQFQDHGQAWMFWPFAQYDHDMYLARVAQYRRQYGAPTPKLEFAGPESMKAEMAVYAKDVRKATDRLVESYGK
jgi:uncharacterized protein YifN (PemK superfamily)